jgi:hypothetical protein
MRRRLLNILFAFFLCATPLPTQVTAQVYDLPQETEPKPTERSTWREWLIGSIFLVGCLVVAFKPAKRVNLG